VLGPDLGADPTGRGRALIGFDAEVASSENDLGFDGVEATQYDGWHMRRL